MSEQHNAQLVQQIYAAFGQGDIPTILGSLTDDAELHHSGPADVIPFAGTYRGSEQWTRFFQELGETFEVEAFEPRESVAQGDKVIALGSYRFRAKNTGRAFESPWAMEWTVRGGKAASCRVYEDTAAMAAALRS